MSKLDFWDQHRGIIKSSKGGWKIGRGIFNHDYEMMADLVGYKSYFQVMVLNATGRMIEKKQADWIEAVFICLSWPDPRIWCNQIGSLGGTLRSSVVASTSVGNMAGDSRLYGQKTLIAGAEFIQSALQEKKKGLTAAEIVAREAQKHRGKPNIVGYARPIAKGDERVVALERYAKELKLSEGEHLLLAREIDNVLLQQYDESINVNGYCCAIMSDFGFSPQETYRISTLLIAGGILACHTDAWQRPAESFYPLRCTDIDYQGPAPRPVPGKENN
ncbi:citrate synthase [Malonomonas rubra DSM 5091]|uniref:Citrate synthase n=1 Tax=Malonomonas rubra DSM 5091 TaxID=1122189 RepID=A0A1M6BHK5_MALRU|nr:hypothetical protein [Malonomonas rubra]SHI48189.1 citrate synthase [Malonomonas rubra DSM 5091]